MKRKSEPELMDLPAEAAAYAQADFASVNQAFVDRVLDLAGGLKNARALDLGTGPADIPIRLLQTLQQKNPGAAWQVTAVDASAPMLDIARRAIEEAGLSGKVELVMADAKRTALPDGRFEVVFSNSILHHIDDTAALWAEVRRLVRPSGLVFFRDLCRPATEELARGLVERYASQETPLLKDEFFRSLLAAYTVGEIRQQVKIASLDGLHVEPITDRHLDIWGILK